MPGYIETISLKEINIYVHTDVNIIHTYKLNIYTQTYKYLYTHRRWLHSGQCERHPYK